MIDRKFSKVGILLPGVLKRLGLEQKFKERQLLTLWPDVVGETLADRTEATHIDQGTMYVRVEPGAWMQELHFIERDLVAKLRAKAPGIRLDRIRFTSREPS